MKIPVLIQLSTGFYQAYSSEKKNITLKLKVVSTWIMFLQILNHKLIILFEFFVQKIITQISVTEAVILSPWPDKGLFCPL